MVLDFRLDIVPCQLQLSTTLAQTCCWDLNPEQQQSTLRFNLLLPSGSNRICPTLAHMISIFMNLAYSFEFWHKVLIFLYYLHTVHTQTHTDTQSYTDTQTQTHRHRHIHTQTQTQTHRHTDQAVAPAFEEYSMSRQWTCCVLCNVGF